MKPQNTATHSPHCLILFLTLTSAITATPIAPIVDTAQAHCYDTTRPIAAPAPHQNFYGQDAQHHGAQPNYTDNQDGTITDHITGLIWSKACPPHKVTLAQAQQIAREMTLAGHSDWRLPTIKELYSLIDFRGTTGLAGRSMSQVPRNAIPYINTDYFDFRYGQTEQGERFIDAQWLSQTINVSPIMHGQRGLFGVNFADGRIKSYPIGTGRNGREKTYYVRYVRGHSNYGKNQLIDNQDGTLTDQATGLMWQQNDSQHGMHWIDALNHAHKSTHAGHDDWRLPNAKELQSIVDYTRSPQATASPAIHPKFTTSPLTNENNQPDYPYYWTSTTHLDGPDARQAIYIAFGRGIGQMHNRIIDAHGAGCQRSDPKQGRPAIGHGPQGDAQRINNYVRLVRDTPASRAISSPPQQSHHNDYPNRIRLADGSHYTPEPLTYNRPPKTRHNRDTP